MPLETNPPRRGESRYVLADELNTFYGHFECNGGSAALPSSASGSSRQRSENDVITVSED